MTNDTDPRKSMQNALAQKEKENLKNFYSIHSGLIQFYKSIDKQFLVLLNSANNDSNTEDSLLKHIESILPELNKLKFEISMLNEGLSKDSEIQKMITYIKEQMVISETVQLSSRFEQMISEKTKVLKGKTSENDYANKSIDDLILSIEKGQTQKAIDMIEAFTKMGKKMSIHGQLRLTSPAMVAFQRGESKVLRKLINEGVVIVDVIMYLLTYPQYRFEDAQELIDLIGIDLKKLIDCYSLMTHYVNNNYPYGIEFLIKNKVEVNGISNKNYNEFLFHAIYKEFYEVAILLVKAGARLDNLGWGTYNNKKLIDYAKHNEDLVFLEILTKAGIKI